MCAISTASPAVGRGVHRSAAHAHNTSSARAGAAIAVVGVFWALLDGLLKAREFDKNNLPARPEYVNFDIYDHPKHLEELGGRQLKSLTFVVFDTETTGLRPSHGDEIISIAGVRIIDGEIRDGDPFTRLVNPGRNIPRASIKRSDPPSR